MSNTYAKRKLAMTESQYVQYVAHMLDESMPVIEADGAGSRFWDPIFREFKDMRLAVDTRSMMDKLAKAVRKAVDSCGMFPKRLARIPIAAMTQAELDAESGVKSGSRGGVMAFYDGAYLKGTKAGKEAPVPDPKNARICVAYGSRLCDSVYAAVSTLCHEMIHQYVAENFPDEIGRILSDLREKPGMSDAEREKAWHGGKFAETSKDIERMFDLVTMTEDDGKVDPFDDKYAESFERACEACDEVNPGNAGWMGEAETEREAPTGRACRRLRESELLIV